MAQKILDGTLSREQYQYSKSYPGQAATFGLSGDKIFFNTYQIYNRSVDQSGVIDQGSLKTFQLVKKGNDWYKGAELREDGKWYALSEKESGILVPNSDPTKPGTFKTIDNASDEKVLGDVVIKDLNAGGTKSLRYQAINNSKFQLKKAGGLTDEQVNREFDISKNIAPPGKPGTPGLLGAPVAADQSTTGITTSNLSKEDLDIINDTVNARTKYNNNKPIIYPETLKESFQDCIKFSILKYQPPGLKGFDQSLAGPRFVSVDDKTGQVGIGEREIIGTIVLPIPGGIRDSNTVNWSDSKLDILNEAIAKVAVSELDTGTGAQAARNQLTAAVAGKTEVRKAIIGKIGSAVAGGEGGIMQRQFGRIVNPNLELLFNAPELRNFSFIFKLSPRSETEAKIVKQIIRTFKQAMSVQRTNSSFLLQTPNTFAISYIFQNKQHPYLNRFKECALKSCSVNYTPEGNYMAFDHSTDPSMVSYELELQFQELEPVFNDDYGNGYNNLGF